MLKNIVLATIVATAAACTAQTESNTASRDEAMACKGDGYEASASSSKVVLGKVELAAHGKIDPYQDDATILYRNVQTKDQAQLNGKKLSINLANGTNLELSCR